MPWQLNGQAEDNQLAERDIEIERLKKVHYVEGGDSDGLPVVLLHDNLASSRWWEATQESLPYHYHSFAFDLRGYGATEYKPANALTDFSADLAELVKAFDLPKFFLVGWGMGGGIAMQYATEHPDTLVGLCLVNSISPKGHKERERDEQVEELSRAVRDQRENEVANYIRHHYFRSGNFPVGNLTQGSENGTGDNANVAAFNYIVGGSMQALNYNYDQHTGLFKALSNFDVHKAVGHLPCPVFAIYGDSDRIIRPEETRELRAALNTDTYDEVTMPFCGHSPMVENSEDFMNCLNGYIGRLNHQHVVNASTVSAAKQMEAKDLLSDQPNYGTNAVSDIAYEHKD